MQYIKVWCEFDISGEFGGNNNEEVFMVPDGVNIRNALIKRYGYLVDDCDLDSIDELFYDLLDYEYIKISEV